LKQKVFQLFMTTAKHAPCFREHKHNEKVL
jgi:hypothetical protein